MIFLLTIEALKGEAKNRNQKFLDLWKDADPGIAEVEEAKKRVGGHTDAAVAKKPQGKTKRAKE